METTEVHRQQLDFDIDTSYKLCLQKNSLSKQYIKIKNLWVPHITNLRHLEQQRQNEFCGAFQFPLLSSPRGRT